MTQTHVWLESTAAPAPSNTDSTGVEKPIYNMVRKGVPPTRVLDVYFESHVLPPWIHNLWVWDFWMSSWRLADLAFFGPATLDLVKNTANANVKGQ